MAISLFSNGIRYANQSIPLDICKVAGSAYCQDVLIYLDQGRPTSTSTSTSGFAPTHRGYSYPH